MEPMQIARSSLVELLQQCPRLHLGKNSQSWDEVATWLSEHGVSVRAVAAGAGDPQELLRKALPAVKAFSAIAGLTSLETDAAYWEALAGEIEVALVGAVDPQEPRETPQHERGWARLHSEMLKLATAHHAERRGETTSHGDCASCQMAHDVITLVAEIERGAGDRPPAPSDVPTDADWPPWDGWFSCPDCLGWFYGEGIGYDDANEVCASCAEKRDATIAGAVRPPPRAAPRRSE